MFRTVPTPAPRSRKLRGSLSRNISTPSTEYTYTTPESKSRIQKILLQPAPTPRRITCSSGTTVITLSTRSSRSSRSTTSELPPSMPRKSEKLKITTTKSSAFIGSVKYRPGEGSSRCFTPSSVVTSFPELTIFASASSAKTTERLRPTASRAGSPASARDVSRPLVTVTAAMQK